LVTFLTSAKNPFDLFVAYVFTRKWIPDHWEIRVLILIQNKQAWWECTDYQDNSFFSLSGKLNANFFGRKCYEITQPKLGDDQ